MTPSHVQTTKKPKIRTKSERKQYFTYRKKKKKKVRIASDISETMQTRRQWNELFSVEREKKKNIYI